MLGDEARSLASPPPAVGGRVLFVVLGALVFGCAVYVGVKIGAVALAIVVALLLEASSGVVWWLLRQRRGGSQ